MSCKGVGPTALYAELGGDLSDILVERLGVLRRAPGWLFPVNRLSRSVLGPVGCGFATGLFAKLLDRFDLHRPFHVGVFLFVGPGPDAGAGSGRARPRR